MILTIPNCLTFFRILAIPLIVVVYYMDLKYGNWYCVILFSLAGISDALDGYLARRWNQTSKLGAFLDPVADKLLVTVYYYGYRDNKSRNYGIGITRMDG